ncbi:tRNA (adenine22-N1)-methyltransferase [Catenibacillus scindens]|uniref:tRNA (Adenine22-N1)-methyltransferase n=1 Tax=Catenibacillus scindens TaxID=673271 RepID=A0A7W8M4H7_9FIRM|nr:tRNA (adenine22-N1)-methyltransferase [Catenibacillus scindens]
MIQISNRLKTVADMVSPGLCPVDVGTDHGYVPLYLIYNHRVDHALAMDINEGPLLKARENIRRHGFESKITVRLSDGLDALGPHEADSLIIAGMGGILMEQILERAKDRGQLGDFKEMILSPHSDLDRVRKAAHRLNFAIDMEQMLVDGGKYYTVIHCVPGNQRYDREEDYIYGKYLLEHKNPVLKDYLSDQIRVRRHRYEQVSRMDTPGAKAYVPCLQEEIRRLEDLLKECML